MSVLEELKRRNVFRIGIAYAVASWVLLQVVDVISPALDLPGWVPKLVLLILGIGVIPVLVFAWAFEITPDGLKKEADVDRSKSIAGETGRKLNYVITGFLVAAVALLLVERQMRPDAAPVVDTELAARAAEREGSIAVLPFVNMSSDAEQECFSDGITEEILNSLASVKELDLLKEAVAQGLSVAMDPEVLFPEFSVLLGDPRFDEIKTSMLENLNYNRRILELPPFDENYQAQL